MVIIDGNTDIPKLGGSTVTLALYYILTLDAVGRSHNLTSVNLI